MSREPDKRADGLADDLAAMRRIPCLCDRRETDADDVAAVLQRCGLVVTILVCKRCWKSWTRIG